MSASSCKVHPRLTFKQRGKTRGSKLLTPPPPLPQSVLRWDKDKMIDREKQHPLMIVLFLLLEKERSGVAFASLRACLHEGEEPQEGEVTRGGSPHLACKRHQIKMRD